MIQDRRSEFLNRVHKGGLDAYILSGGTDRPRKDFLPSEKVAIRGYGEIGSDGEKNETFGINIAC